jgi:hypothetical protein
MKLCGINNCRLIEGHKGNHDPFPSIWNDFDDKDKNKINKAGFATPRGGAKNAYQNHVTRSNKVIIPFEKLAILDKELFKDGYIIRILPEQYFDSNRKVKEKFKDDQNEIIIGKNAFLLYKSWDSFRKYPPLDGWQVRGLKKGRKKVKSRGKGVVDTGHYVLRLNSIGDDPKKYEGPPQGIFAIEYADIETNYLSKCLLSLLIVCSYGSPYTLNTQEHLKLILKDAQLLDFDIFENSGTMRRGYTCCPLCLKVIHYNELHDTVSFEESDALANASQQSGDTTRSTIVNLFHLKPLLYHKLTHIPLNLGWGHAICNTYLGQRECLSLSELKADELKVAIMYENHIETFGWISKDLKFIRSPKGAVWIQISSNMADDDWKIEYEL